MQRATSTPFIVCAILLTSKERESISNKSKITTKTLVETDISFFFSPYYLCCKRIKYEANDHSWIESVLNTDL